LRGLRGHCGRGEVGGKGGVSLRVRLGVSLRGRYVDRKPIKIVKKLRQVLRMIIIGVIFF